MTKVAYEDVELAPEGVLDRGDELLSVGAHGDVADRDGDVQPLVGPPPAARLQLRCVPGARTCARAHRTLQVPPRSHACPRTNNARTVRMLLSKETRALTRQPCKLY
jgi:hypothetical protein